jgi:putative transposase
MIRTFIFNCRLPLAICDELNQESGRVYTRILTTHYRVYRKKGRWLTHFTARRLDDFYGAADERLLNSASIDEAQEGFYKACKTARACRKLGLGVKYPHKPKKFRTTVWNKNAIRVADGTLLLSRARGLERLRVRLSDSLPVGSILEVRLVYDRVSRKYNWHFVIEDGQAPLDAPGVNVAAVDLGEVHPAAVSDGSESMVFAARELRAVLQFRHKRLAAIQRLQAAKVKGSRAWKKLQRRKTRFLARQARRARDIEHKVSRAVVNWMVERGVGTLAMGDVRDVADGKRLNTKSQQKVSSWGHGKMRQYITYKAEGAGITVELVDEAYSSQTCPMCGQRHKPAGRVYACPVCGFRGHRDGQVGAVNLLSRFIHGDVGQVRPPPLVKYRHPFRKDGTGKRSRPDTGSLAVASVACAGP